jgi:type II secretory pathway pseudopilin PulG
MTREDGMALPAAAGVLAVILLLAAWAASGATDLSGKSNRDRDSKRALGAAEGGLQAAIYRLSQLNPPAAKCLTNVAVDPGAGGECPGYTEDVGSGTSYTYYVTPALDAGGSCPTTARQPTTDKTYRCITSTGVANGTTRRVQANIAARRALGTPGAPSIVGLDRVTLDRSGVVNGTIASNGLITLSTGNDVQRLEIGPSAPDPSYNPSNTTVDEVVRRSSAWAATPLDFGNSATVNDNARIADGSDPSINVTYRNSGGNVRDLSTGAGATLELRGATYNFCRFVLGRDTRITIPTGGRVKIFIDSPSRAGSGCPGGTGVVNIGQRVIWDNQSGNPSNLEIHMWGTPSVTWDQGGSFAGIIRAPDATIQFQQALDLYGGVEARNLTFRQGVNVPVPASALSEWSAASGPYSGAAWGECRAEPPVAGDPESGC